MFGLNYFAGMRMGVKEPKNPNLLGFIKRYALHLLSQFARVSWLPSSPLPTSAVGQAPGILPHEERIQQTGALSERSRDCRIGRP